MAEKIRPASPAGPWVTVAFAALALLLAAWPAAQGQAIYDRGAIFAGQWWRVYTGNFVHFSWSHLAWNLAVLLPTGIWLERRWPGPARGFQFLSPLVIGLVLLGFAPRLDVYAGLSGVVIGLVTLLALLLRMTSASDRWWANTVLLLVAIKLTAEGMKGGPLFAQFSAQSIRVVSLAHVAGVIAAAGIFSLFYLRNRQRRDRITAFVPDEDNTER